jgi:hypothetical protein
MFKADLWSQVTTLLGAMSASDISVDLVFLLDLQLKQSTRQLILVEP